MRYSRWLQLMKYPACQLTATPFSLVLFPAIVISHSSERFPASAGRTARHSRGVLLLLMGRHLLRRFMRREHPPIQQGSQKQTGTPRPYQLHPLHVAHFAVPLIDRVLRNVRTAGHCYKCAAGAVSGLAELL